MSYSRYKSFIVDGAYKKVPFIKIPVNGTDCYEFYEYGKTRLDLLSYQYYNDPNYAWLILQANPQYGSLEYKLDNNVRLRIPYPLDSAIQRYDDEVKKYNRLNGIN